MLASYLYAFRVGLPAYCCLPRILLGKSRKSERLLGQIHVPASQFAEGHELAHKGDVESLGDL